MISYLAVIFFSCYLFTQSDVIVVRDKNASNIISKLELSIWESVINLYNETNSEKLAFKITFINSNRDVFNYMLKMAISKKDNIVALSNITISKDRSIRFDFSSVYLPAHEAIITLKDTSDLANIKPLNIGFEQFSLNESMANRLDNSLYLTKGFKTEHDVVDALLNKKIQGIIISHSSAWTNSNLFIYRHFPIVLSSGLAFMFPKGSNLKDKIEPTLKYYLKSKAFLELLSKSFNDEIIREIRKGLFNHAN